MQLLLSLIKAHARLNSEPPTGDDRYTASAWSSVQRSVNRRSTSRPLMMEASRIENFASEKVRGRAVHAHRRILQPIEHSYAETARRRAECYVQAHATYLEAAVESAAKEHGSPMTDAAD